MHAFGSMLNAFKRFCADSNDPVGDSIFDNPTNVMYSSTCDGSPVGSKNARHCSSVITVWSGNAFTRRLNMAIWSSPVMFKVSRINFCSPAVLHCAVVVTNLTQLGTIPFLLPLIHWCDAMRIFTIRAADKLPNSLVVCWAKYIIVLAILWIAMETPWYDSEQRRWNDAIPDLLAILFPNTFLEAVFPCNCGYWRIFRLDRLYIR